MIVEGFEEERQNGRIRISASFILEGNSNFLSGQKSERLYFDFPEHYSGYTEITADPFALVAMTVAANTGENLSIRGMPISSQFYLNLLEIMHVYHWFFPRMVKIIEIHCKTENRLPVSKERIGSFFSGGVDSLFNIAELKKFSDKTGMGQVTDLWIVHGMDIPIDNEEKWETVHSRLIEMSKTIPHKEIIDIKTNIKAVMDGGILRYSNTGAGIALGAVAKCFAGQVSTALIGSYDVYKKVTPRSTSPFVDPLFSCDQQSVRHFTCRVSRLEKEHCIYDVLPEVLKNIRVCTNDDSQEHNCGTCEKCLRTKAEFLIVGIPLSATDFDNCITVADILSLRFPVRKEDRSAVVAFWKEILWQFLQIKHYNLAVALSFRMLTSTIYINLLFRTWRRRTRGLRDSFKSFLKIFSRKMGAV